LGAIRLAWWREALERLDSKPPPPEPRLQAVAVELLPRGIGGKQLAELEDGWATLLDEEPEAGRIGGRGERLFTIGATLLAAEDARLNAAGQLYALGQVRRRGLASIERPTGQLKELAGHRFPRQLRPLTAFARLAARDVKQAPAIEPEATPGRAASLLSHRILGVVA
jgi:phytoene synthase